VQTGVRGRYGFAVIAVIVASVAVGFAIISHHDSDARTVEVPALGISADVPNGWSQRSLYPERLSLYVGESVIAEDCPEGVDTTVWVDVSGRIHPDVAVGPRPEHFHAASGITQTEQEAADLSCGMTSQYVQFTDHDRTLSAAVLFGSRASSARLAEAYRILDSLNVARTDATR
jgi:hypothetical protein